MSISVFDPSLWDEKTPANVIGGRNRSRLAKRDKLGRFMPNDQFLQSLWALPEQHGRQGGLKILEKYGREYFSKIAKRRKSAIENQ